jgi:RNA polymerase sigma factor (TIGR02999 family)
MLLDWSSGSTDARDRLMTLVYRDLRRIAQKCFQHEGKDHTLQATALVHDAYLRLVDQRRVHWQNRAQFFAVAATLMRRLLVSHARARHAAKRGGGAVVVTLDEARGVGFSQAPDLLALDGALKALRAFAPRQSRVVTLRCFGGLSIEETSEVLGVSPATVKLDWSLAKAWLFRELAADASGQV